MVTHPQTEIGSEQPAVISLLLHPSQVVEEASANQQAVATDRAPVLYHRQAVHVTTGIGLLAHERTASWTVQPQHQPGTDNRAVTVTKLGTDHTDLRALRMTHQFIEPLPVKNHATDIEQQQIVAARILASQVDQPRRCLGIDIDNP
ncbi:hypothetical protein D3C76_1048820 [compost metagenome]